MTLLLPVIVQTHSAAFVVCCCRPSLPLDPKTALLGFVGQAIFLGVALFHHVFANDASAGLLHAC